MGNNGLHSPGYMRNEIFLSVCLSAARGSWDTSLTQIFSSIMVHNKDLNASFFWALVEQQVTCINPFSLWALGDLRWEQKGPILWFFYYVLNNTGKNPVWHSVMIQICGGVLTWGVTEHSVLVTTLGWALGGLVVLSLAVQSWIMMNCIWAPLCSFAQWQGWCSTSDFHICKILNILQ